MNWDLTLIYKSKEDYLKDFNSLEADVVAIENLKGRLNTEEALVTYKRVTKELFRKVSKIFTYVSMAYDLNQKDNINAMEVQKVYQKYNEISVRTSFTSPEIISYGKELISNIVNNNEELKVLGYSMENLFRNQDFFLDAKSEALMANYGNVVNSFSDLYDKLAVSDRNGVKVTVSTGEELELNESNFQYYLGILNNQDDRRIVFEAIYKYYEAHKNTFATIYNGLMQSEMVEVKNRGYNNILESHLYHNNIPSDVFYSLIDVASNDNAPLKRYIELRRKHFGIETYHTYDRFLQFSKSNTEYSYEASKEMVLDACKALGEDYYNHACQALEDGRVSAHTSDGKRTGAYSTSTYEEGTFILLNHNNNLDSAFTVAHEAGHSIHSLYSNENQEFENANYTIFVAEIASTFNEQLFLDYIMKKSNDKAEKIQVLQQALDNIMSTFYRQTLFANYEDLAHKLVENGTPVTCDALQGIMEELYLKYYGIDLKNEPLKNNVWAYIPHFYHSPYYVYQYATSFAASLAIYENVKTGDKSALENYIKMLSMGGSTYPVDIVKVAGVDLTKTDAFKAVVNRMNELVDQLEALLNE